MINKERVIYKFMEYVKVDSETLNEGEFCNLIVKELTELGLEIYTDKAGEKIGSNGNNIYAYMKGTKDIEPLMFSAHMDTVKPGIGIDPVVEGGIITSKTDTILGGDDKSGIVAVMEALRVIKENNLPCGPVEVIFTISEEGGLRGSKNLEYDKVKSKQAIVLDSSGDVGTIIIKAPAQNLIKFKVIGKPAHAGIAPEKGVSAIMVASEAISSMKLLRIDDETTANIGKFNGGVATNIVCPEAIIIAEVRSLNDEKLKIQTDHMVKCFQDATNKHGATLECEVSNSYYSYDISKDNKLVKMATDVFNRIGIKPKQTSTGGGSDANIFCANDISVINVATGMEKVHTLQEYIKVQSLVDISKFVLEVMLRQN
ncbi:M20/M25/M40 family metallo-hydrolase [Clostridiaceae bacterium M8S5]|nr:M20/M25/M40 family metallo-hydrolase [Clostridiaceae bacterium M8S5]